MAKNYKPFISVIRNSTGAPLYCKALVPTQKSTLGTVFAIIGSIKNVSANFEVNMYIHDETNNRWIPLRQTAEYKKKKKLVRDAWIIVGLVMIGLPLSFVMALGLVTTFVSFMFLDESIYSYNL